MINLRAGPEGEEITFWWTAGLYTVLCPNNLEGGGEIIVSGINGEEWQVVAFEKIRLGDE